jgi:hypothetical protein
VLYFLDIPAQAESFTVSLTPLGAFDGVELFMNLGSQAAVPSRTNWEYRASSALAQSSVTVLSTDPMFVQCPSQTIGPVSCRALISVGCFGPQSCSYR